MNKKIEAEAMKIKDLCNKNKFIDVDSDTNQSKVFIKLFYKFIIKSIKK